MGKGRPPTDGGARSAPSRVAPSGAAVQQLVTDSQLDLSQLAASKAIGLCAARAGLLSICRVKLPCRFNTL